MRTGLTKRQKTTEIFFDETKSRITVYTHNTDLKKRLTAYAEQYPDHCAMTDEDSETGYKAFEIEKGRLSFRLTAPYSEERRGGCCFGSLSDSISAWGAYFAHPCGTE